MHIGTFAGYARRLEETSSRTALVAVLAELFAAATPDDVAPATYLLQGRVAPAFVPLELGMGVVLVTEAVARAFHTEPALVRERFDRVGDVGIVAAQLAEEAGRDPAAEATPSVRTVFERLHAIAETAGPGSAARKIALLAEVLTPLDPASVASSTPTPSPRWALAACARAWSAPTTRPATSA